MQPTKQFYYSATSASGYYPWCKPCHKLWVQQYRRNKKGNKRSLQCQYCKSDIQRDWAAYGIKGLKRTCENCLGNGHSKLDYCQQAITPATLEWADGLVISDGSIHSNYKNSYYCWGVKHKEFSQYIASRLSSLNGSTNQTKYMWWGCTATHPDISKQGNRWYPNKTKIVPHDLKITPNMLLMWYLGDGSICKNSGTITLSTDCFSYQDHIVMVDKLSTIGVDATINSIHRSRNNKTYYYLRVSNKKVAAFFNIIGHKSPVECYGYKFSVPNKTRKSLYSFITANKLTKVAPSLLTDKTLSRWKQNNKCENCNISTTSVEKGTKLSTRVYWQYINKKYVQVCRACRFPSSRKKIPA